MDFTGTTFFLFMILEEFFFAFMAFSYDLIERLLTLFGPGVA
jgi:hypothetical protein